MNHENQETVPYPPSWLTHPEKSVKMPANSWKKMPEGKEKYGMYLCSREWAVLKRAVRKRAGGMCERCRCHRIDSVHHLTYERKYAERLEDLLGLCNGCHEFTHGKSDHDPKPRPKIYMAGKFSSNNWRRSLVNRDLNEHSGGNGVLTKALTIAGQQFDYTGPFFVDLECHVENKGNHAASGTNHGQVDDCDRERVREHCLRGVRDSDIVFAWIAERTCFGTIAEIGYAHAYGKTIWIGMANQKLADQMWFVRMAADYFLIDDSPGMCLEDFTRRYLIHA